MAKITLGVKPKTFKPFDITFPLPDGEEGKIHVTYKYRTLTEWAQLNDEVFRNAAQPAKTGADPAVGFLESLMAHGNNQKVEFLLKAIETWDVEGHDIDRETLLQLADELPAAVTALKTGYDTACRDGRLGN